MEQEITNLAQPNSDAPQQKERAPLHSAVTNFARFFAAFNRLPYGGNREEFRKQVVLQYTWNRTASLREMTRREYNDCCDALERLNGEKDGQRKLRSINLKLMQKLGIDTTDWTRINAFCRDPRIAGKVFARLDSSELEALSVKLRSIQRKGGLRPKAAPVQAYRPQAGCILLDFGNGGEA